MVKFHVQVAFPKFIDTPQVISRRNAGECQEIADEMRLIEIAAVERNLPPI